MEGQLKDDLSALAERFTQLEVSVASLSEQLKSDKPGRRAVAEAAEDFSFQPQPGTEAFAEVGSFSDLQAEFKAIRDSVAKVKLPPDLVVGDSRTGVSRGDWPKFQTIQKCARFQETLLKLLSQCASSEPVLQDITTITLAQLRFLQEEYTNLLVANQFDDGTTRLFQTLQQNPAAFTPGALENLQRAVTIAGARQNRQVSGPGRFRGRGSFFASAGRGFRPDLQGQRPGPAGSGAGPADWRYRRGRFGAAAGPRDLSSRGHLDDVTGACAAD